MNILIVADNKTEFFEYVNSLHPRKKFTDGYDGPQALSRTVDGNMYMYLSPTGNGFNPNGYAIRKIIMLTVLPLKTYEYVIQHFHKPRTKRETLIKKIKELEDQLCTLKTSLGT